jgi:hypothetical protein
MNTFYRKVIQTLVVTIAIMAATAITQANAGSHHSGGAMREAGRHFSGGHHYKYGVVPAYEKPYGKSYGDWGAEWWKWALSVPFDHSPIVDPNGQDGNLNQRGPVWFLAGTFGVHAERWITVPANKAIFFPLVNTWNDYPCPDPNFKPALGQSMYSFLADGADAQIYPWFNDQTNKMPNVLSAAVDGVVIPRLLSYRGISSLTPFKAHLSNTLIDPCITGDKQVGVADGFWIMLEPMEP